MGDPREEGVVTYICPLLCVSALAAQELPIDLPCAHVRLYAGSDALERLVSGLHDACAWRETKQRLEDDTDELVAALGAEARLVLKREDEGGV